MKRYLCPDLVENEKSKCVEINGQLFSIPVYRQEEVDAIRDEEAEGEGRIAELEKENDRLKGVLEELARLGGPPGQYGNSTGNEIAKRALEGK